jgi:hypothetical protein
MRLDKTLVRAVMREVSGGNHLQDAGQPPKTGTDPDQTAKPPIWLGMEVCRRR